MTDRLYYSDSYLTSFRASVTEARENGQLLYLDRTLFYPTSGGQPHDLGTINGVAVVEVVDEDTTVAHRLAAPLAGAEVEGQIDWARRFDHMQQHSGQHLLSAILVRDFGFETVSFHLGADISTIELATASISAAQLGRAEASVNEAVFANHPLAVTYEDAAAVEGLRKASERSGTLRIVSIPGLDRSACGGTHVRSTGEIGSVLLRRTEKIRGNVRLEFLCGMRAVRRARADFDALNKAAQVFSSAPDDVPALVATQQDKLQEAEKSRRKLAAELAVRRGRELYAACEPAPRGLRIREVTLASALDDEVRNEANGFVSQSKAAYLALSKAPPAVLLALSPDAGINAGAVLKELLAGAGGRGGGSAQLAQGSVPNTAALDALAAQLRAKLS
jgi:alanyl-tRNA synthetase